MIFNTWAFGLFITLFFLIYWLVLKPQWRLAGILTASLIFYTYFSPSYTVLIVLLSLFVYISGKFILKVRGSQKGLKNPKVLLWLSVTVCVLVLGYYKYTRMILTTINDIAAAAGSNGAVAIPKIMIPLGLSFFIFEFIHYLVDCYYGRTKDSGILEFGVFAMFFPTLVSGPIKRFHPFAAQMRSKIEYKPEFLANGAKRIIIGLAKKIIIADIIGMYALPLTSFSTNPHTGPLSLWLAAYAYAVKIYFDFSGYSDIAIGTAKLLGFEVPENFNKPYLRQNIAEFWRNWHMSLTSWLKDYIYMPIGKKLMPTIGRKHPLLLAGICQMITMGVSGLWHGASWNFVIWGLYHGFGMTVHRVFMDVNNKIKRAGNDKQNGGTNKQSAFTSTLSYVKKPAFIFLTFNFVTVGWVFFVLDAKTAIKAIGRMFLLW